MRWATASSLSVDRATSATLAPRFAAASAVAAPIPLDAPVINRNFPDHSMEFHRKIAREPQESTRTETQNNIVHGSISRVV
jgi:hypothetical protein